MCLRKRGPAKRVDQRVPKPEETFWSLEVRQIRLPEDFVPDVECRLDENDFRLRISQDKIPAG